MKKLLVLSLAQRGLQKNFKKAKNLQVISRCGTGTDNIDKAIFKTDIKIFKTDKEPVLAVSEFVIAQILSVLKIVQHNF